MAGEGSSRPPDYSSDVPHPIWFFDSTLQQNLVHDQSADHSRTCPCRITHSYPNRVVHMVERERDLLARDLYQNRVNQMEHINFLDSCLELAYKENDRLKSQVKDMQERLDAFTRMAREMWMKVANEDGHSEIGEIRASEGSVNDRHIPVVHVADDSEEDPEEDSGVGPDDQA